MSDILAKIDQVDVSGPLDLCAHDRLRMFSRKSLMSWLTREAVPHPQHVNLAQLTHLVVEAKRTMRLLERMDATWCKVCKNPPILCDCPKEAANA